MRIWTRVPRSDQGLRGWKHLSVELRPSGEVLLHAPSEARPYPIWATSSCLAHAAVPARRCGCGFHARSTLLSGPAGLLSAEVELTGRTLVEGDLLRGQHQHLVGLELTSCAQHSCNQPATCLRGVAHEHTAQGWSQMIRGSCASHLPRTRSTHGSALTPAELAELLGLPVRPLPLVPEMRAASPGS